MRDVVPVTRRLPRKLTLKDPTISHGVILEIKPSTCGCVGTFAKLPCRKRFIQLVSEWGSQIVRRCERRVTGYIDKTWNRQWPRALDKQLWRESPHHLLCSSFHFQALFTECSATPLPPPSSPLTCFLSSVSFCSLTNQLWSPCLNCIDLGHFRCNMFAPDNISVTEI